MSKDKSTEAPAILGRQPGHPEAVAKPAKVLPHMTSEASIMSVESDDDVNDLTGKQSMFLQFF